MFIEHVAENQSGSKKNQSHLLYRQKHQQFDHIKGNLTKSNKNYRLPTGHQVQHEKKLLQRRRYFHFKAEGNCSSECNGPPRTYHARTVALLSTPAVALNTTGILRE
jgi:hypothetical protein